MFRTGRNYNGNFRNGNSTLLAKEQVQVSHPPRLKHEVKGLFLIMRRETSFLPLQKKVKEHNGTGLQIWKVRARTLCPTMGITCTEMLGQAMLSMSQSIKAVHKNSVGCLAFKVKDCFFSIPSYLRNYVCGLICRGRI